MSLKTDIQVILVTQNEDQEKTGLCFLNNVYFPQLVSVPPSLFTCQEQIQTQEKRRFLK